jgi:Fe-S cluster assembly iron-binding protein IscA
MTLTLTDAAREVIKSLFAADPTRPALRISFVGGCGAPGYRLSTAVGPMTGDEIVVVDGVTVFVDYKTRTDLDGARIDAGDEADEGLIIVHDRAAIGDFC